MQRVLYNNNKRDYGIQVANSHIYSSESGEILIRGIGLLVVSYEVDIHFCRRFAGEFQGPGR
jgi:hypothetical protein